MQLLRTDGGWGLGRCGWAALLIVGLARCGDESTSAVVGDAGTSQDTSVEAAAEPGASPQTGTLGRSEAASRRSDAMAPGMAEPAAGDETSAAEVSGAPASSDAGPAQDAGPDMEMPRPEVEPLIPQPPADTMAELADAGAPPTPSPATDPMAVSDASAPEPVTPAPSPESAATGQEPTPGHNCGWGEPADARDAMIQRDYDIWNGAFGAVDLLLPPPVTQWMAERVWDSSHNLWHTVRQCDSRAGLAAFGAPGLRVCSERPEWVAANQTCENARDGYEFLVMHRHMLESLRQAFPRHAYLFAGFPSFPLEAQDVPEPLRASWGQGWAPEILETAALLEDIESNLDLFPTEGDLGMFMQCGSAEEGTTAVHRALHFKWSQFLSPRNLGDQSRDLGNYMFWKLHGWIDDIWQRYRVAKGLDQDPKDALAAELQTQCWEMHDLGHLAAELGRDPQETQPLPEESGVFHENIRRIFDAHCSSCHSGPIPSGNLVLGGPVSSAALLAGLVNQPAASGGGALLIAPGEPEASWLYLRASDQARTVACQGNCSSGVMPPIGEVTLSVDELAALREWIADGAPGPR